MTEELNDLKIKLEFMQNNISEINLYLEESKRTKNNRIPKQVFDLHKETTNCAKEVSDQLKAHSFGADFKEMHSHRMLLMDFLSTLSDLSLLQRQIIDKTVNTDCVDCGRISQMNDSNTVLSQLIGTNRSAAKLWLTIGIVVIGGISILRALRN